MNSENGKKAIPWYPIALVVGMVLSAIVTYYSSQISFAEELGNRPTRTEMQQQLTEIKEIIVREVKEIKDQQKVDAASYARQQQAVRQDIRELTRLVIERLG